MNVCGVLVVTLVAGGCVAAPAEERSSPASEESNPRPTATAGEHPAQAPAPGAVPRKRVAESPTSRNERAAGEGSILHAASQAGVDVDGALRDFTERIDKYLHIHRDAAKGVAKPKENDDPAKIISTQDALAARIRNARSTAQPGDIFTPQIRGSFRRLLAPPLKGEDGRDAKALMKDDAPPPQSIPFKVNAKYPEGAPVPTVPATVLLSLPTLPKPLEYRIIGKHLLLLDTDAGLVVDFIPNAIS